MKKMFLKYLFIVLMVIGTGALVYAFAQRGFLFNGQARIKTAITNEEAAPEDIGVLTDDDPWKEMNNLVDSYYKDKGVSYRGYIRLIDDNGDRERVIEEHSFLYSTIGTTTYYQLAKMEFISKADLVLIADHSNKFISVSQTLPAKNETKKIFDIKQFKKLMEDSKASAKVTQLGNQKMLTIENITDPQVQGYRIYYDPVTFQINKMLIGMLRLSPLDDEGSIEELPDVKAKNERGSKVPEDELSDDGIDTYTYYMEIIYDKTEQLNMTLKTFKPESKFINISENKIRLMPAFSKYHLVCNGAIQNETEENIEQ